MNNGNIESYETWLKSVVDTNKKEEFKDILPDFENIVTDMEIAISQCKGNVSMELIALSAFFIKNYDICDTLHLVKGLLELIAIPSAEAQHILIKKIKEKVAKVQESKENSTKK